MAELVTGKAYVWELKTWLHFPGATAQTLVPEGGSAHIVGLSGFTFVHWEELESDQLYVC